ncbi:hypothetical protein QJS66_01705 [Kocuria rhizophila]|nr:hypothetical protein QJS66_01705 [Kocuria rhizophila]
MRHRPGRSTDNDRYGPAALTGRPPLVQVRGPTSRADCGIRRLADSAPHRPRPRVRHRLPAAAWRSTGSTDRARLGAGCGRCPADTTARRTWNRTPPHRPRGHGDPRGRPARAIAAATTVERGRGPRRSGGPPPRRRPRRPRKRPRPTGRTAAPRPAEHRVPERRPRRGRVPRRRRPPMPGRDTASEDDGSAQRAPAPTQDDSEPSARYLALSAPRTRRSAVPPRRRRPACARPPGAPTPSVRRTATRRRQEREASRQAAPAASSRGRGHGAGRRPTAP